MFITEKFVNKVQNNDGLCFLHVKNSAKGEKLWTSDAHSHKCNGEIIASYVPHQFQVTADHESDRKYDSEWQYCGNDEM